MSNSNKLTIVDGPHSLIKYKVTKHLLKLYQDNDIKVSNTKGTVPEVKKYNNKWLVFNQFEGVYRNYYNFIRNLIPRTDVLITCYIPYLLAYYGAGYGFLDILNEMVDEFFNTRLDTLDKHPDLFIYCKVDVEHFIGDEEEDFKKRVIEEFDNLAQSEAVDNIFILDCTEYDDEELLNNVTNIFNQFIKQRSIFED